MLEKSEAKIIPVGTSRSYAHTLDLSPACRLSMFGQVAEEGEYTSSWKGWTTGKKPKIGSKPSFNIPQQIGFSWNIPEGLTWALHTLQPLSRVLPCSFCCKFQPEQAFHLTDHLLCLYIF